MREYVTPFFVALDFYLLNFGWQLIQLSCQCSYYEVPLDFLDDLNQFASISISHTDNVFLQ